MLKAGPTKPVFLFTMGRDGKWVGDLSDSQWRSGLPIELRKGPLLTSLGIEEKAGEGSGGHCNLENRYMPRNTARESSFFIEPHPTLSYNSQDFMNFGKAFEAYVSIHDHLITG